MPSADPTATAPNGDQDHIRATAARPCPNCGALVTWEQSHACLVTAAPRRLRRSGHESVRPCPHCGESVTLDQAHTCGPYERPIIEDFYRSPSGEWVYRWSDERLVLKEGPTDGT